MAINITAAQQTQISQLYVAFFNRAADSEGLGHWANELAGGKSIEAIAQDFYNTAPARAYYSTALTNEQFIKAFYATVLNRPNPDADGVAFWTALLGEPGSTQGSVAVAIIAAVQTYDGVLPEAVAAKAMFDARVEVSTAYALANGNIVNATIVLEGVVDQATADAAIANLGTGGIGSTFTLTAGVDTIVGTAGNDTINSALNATATLNTLNSFDNINGGAGTDTLNIASTGLATAFALPAGTTIAGIEIVNVSNSGTNADTNAVTVTNTTFGTGVQKLNWVEAGAGTTAAASVILNSATDVSVVSKGVAFTTVAVTDTSETAALTGNTLKTVTIEKATGVATLIGNGITTVNLNAVGGLTTVTAAAATRELTVNASGTTAQGGLTDAQATTATLNVTGAQDFGTLTVAKAGTVNINSNAATTAAVVAATATTLNLGGTNLLTLTAAGTNAALTTVNVTGAGGVSSDLSGITTLTSLNTSTSTAAAPATGVLTGANSFTIGTGVAVTGGAGQEVITVGATTKAINLGAGNDTVNLSVTALGVGGSIVGGDGVDTLKLSNANALTLSAAGAAQTAFKAAVTGFETLDITTQSASTIAVDGFGTFSTVKMASASAAQVFTGVASGTTFDVTYAAVGTSITTNALTGAADTASLILRGDLSGAVRVFGELATPGAETVNVTTVDTNTTFAATLATLTVTDAAATVINISGNNGVALTHAGTALNTFNAGGLTKGAVTFTAGALTTDVVVTGSATGNDTLNFADALGKVTMTVAGGTNALTGSLVAVNTITGGSGADTITGGNLADVLSGGAGADRILAGTGNDTLTGGAGVDTFVMSGTVAAVFTNSLATTAGIDWITDFVAGTDKIALVNTGVAVTSAVVTAVTVATAADVATLLTAIGTSVAATVGGAEQVGLITVSAGAMAGTYLLVNDLVNGASATDTLINITGVSGTVTAADFLFA